MVRGLLSRVGQTFLKLSGRDRLTERVAFRYDRPKEMLIDVINYLYYSFKYPRAFLPTSLNIEPLNKCNLACIECSVNRGMKREKGLMKLKTLQKIIDDNRFINRVYLTNYGEPLMHPRIFDMIRYARAKGINVGLVTNATLLTDKVIDKILASDLNTICFSLDGVDEIFEKVRGWDYKDVEKKILRFLEANNDSGHKITIRINMVEFEATAGQSEALHQRWGEKVDLIMVTPLMRPGRTRKKPCLYLWRGLTTLWDGRVVPCCVDEEALLVVGSVDTGSLLEIFNQEKMVRLRRLHLQGKFPYPCRDCNDAIF